MHRSGRVPIFVLLVPVNVPVPVPVPGFLRRMFLAVHF